MVRSRNRANHGKSRVVGNTLGQSRVVRVALRKPNRSVKLLNTRGRAGTSRVLAARLGRRSVAMRRGDETSLPNTARTDTLSGLARLKF